MEWYEGLKALLGIAVFAVPVVMLVLIGIYVVLMPCGFLAGLVLRLGEPTREGAHERKVSHQS